MLSFQRELLADQQAQWRKILLQALREGKMILAKTNTKDYRLNLYPYLCVLEDREYVDIMIQVIQTTAQPNARSLGFNKDVSVFESKRFDRRQLYFTTTL